MKVEVKPLERKKRKKHATTFSSLPDEIVVSCLARISRLYYPTLSIVSKSFHSLLSSTELVARSHLGSTERSLYVCLDDYTSQYPQWFRLLINPNPKTKKKRIMVPMPPSNFPMRRRSAVVVVGSEIYVIGGVCGAPSSAVRVLDCRSHTWRDAPNMKVARVYAHSCVYHGKIYVMGGCKGLEEEKPWGKVFDTKTLTWECLSYPGTQIRKLAIYRIAEMEGKIKLMAYNGTYFAYDTKQGKWECSENENATLPRSECVIENVTYRYYRYGKCLCEWYDINDENWKEVKGLNSIRNKYMKNGGSKRCLAKLVSCGGKLLLIWVGYEMSNPNGMKNIWCAEIMVEKRDEVWGNVEWVDVVHTVSREREDLLHCLALSV